MRNLKFYLAACSLWLFFAEHPAAHVGNQASVLEGDAGPFRVRVIAKAPGVVPGIAEISVRVLRGEALTVTVQPIHSSVGPEGSPRPDPTKRVEGTTDLFTGELWLMENGAYLVSVTVKGEAGEGTLDIPLNSIATKPVTMPPWMVIILLGLAFILVSLFVSMLYAAALNSTKPADQRVATSDRIRAVIVTMAGTGFLSWLLYGGWNWWQAEDAHYKNNRMYRALKMEAQSRFSDNQATRLVSLSLDSESLRRRAGFAADHGKLMHLFAIRTPQLDAFAHLHPFFRENGEFEFQFPPLPGGDYLLYGDVAYEDGFSETATSLVHIPKLPESSQFRNAVIENSGQLSDPICGIVSLEELQIDPDAPIKPDPDDSWHLSRSDASETQAIIPLAEGLRMEWKTGPRPMVGETSEMNFRIIDAQGRPTSIQPYLGMNGHAVVRKTDGMVYSHLHPSGTTIMPTMKKIEVSSSNATSVSFPYLFPMAGDYQLWVQLRHNNRVYTGTFTTHVQDALQ